MPVTRLSSSHPTGPVSKPNCIQTFHSHQLSFRRALDHELSAEEMTIALDMYMFGLFEESNFDAYDRGRYPLVLETGVVQNGLTMDDVLAVTQDFGLWAICTTGIFHADLRGVFKKRIEVDDLIPYRRMMEAQVEPSGPHSGKIVVRDDDSKKLAEIEFSPAGPNRTVEGAQAHCRHVMETMRQAWAQAQ
jgi:hypothetical protein